MIISLQFFQALIWDYFQSGITAKLLWFTDMMGYSQDVGSVSSDRLSHLEGRSAGFISPEQWCQHLVGIKDRISLTLIRSMTLLVDQTQKELLTCTLSPNKVLLNDSLYAGPNFGQNILEILFQFRVFRIAVTADMEKAFLMVSFAKEDQDAMR